MFGSKIELISILLSSRFISSSPRASYTGFNENIVVELHGITIMQLLPTKYFCKTISCIVDEATALRVKRSFGFGRMEIVTSFP